ncbi:transglycosylase SLT domain-containing protein [Citrobacter sp. NCU1]|uniref:transglycosylase SLT domain-containing protein n=1 Tax=Citrobacter sp. NCU1 TaxID=2026683 RepID=UPI001391CC65|nr:transglycosylase SLT domain-containing protein [Citrobacter sp. NCU1]
MNSISKSKGSWVKAMLAGGLLILSAPLMAQEVVPPRQGEGTAMNWQSRHPDVALYESLYRKEAVRIQGLMTRSAPSIRFIVTQLQRRKLPLELLFVPLVESGYDPYAESSAGAVGPWQLMPKTAKQYGVIRYDWYDGRKDLSSSTRGALNYLSYLYNLFERDWLLALAAYNAGEGTVQEAITQNKAKGRQTDFWSLSLPDETRQYVPRLLALVRLYRSGRIQLPAVPEASRLVALHVEDGVSLAWLARKLGRTTEELSYYNAGLENAVAPKGSRIALLLPAGWGKRARQALGTRSDPLPLTQEKAPPQTAKRRALPDKDLETLGWGVGLWQKTPGAADLYSVRQTNDNKSAQDKGAKKETQPQTLSLHWRSSIEPLSQWNRVTPENPAKPETASP